MMRMLMLVIISGLLAPTLADDRVWQREASEAARDFVVRLTADKGMPKALHSNVEKVLLAYPETWKAFRWGAEGADLQLSSGLWLPFSRSRLSDHAERLANPTLEEMLTDAYPATVESPNWPANLDPGRYRSESFFKEVYGGTEAAVRANLEEVSFLGRKLMFNKKNGGAGALRKVAAMLAVALPDHPEWEPYLSKLGGTFNWRTVAGTTQLSAHSFGIAIDTNPDRAAYWRWSKEPQGAMSYRRAFPAGIVQAFEACGFIWGGKWWAYDLMHFEYRPEFFVQPRG
jgi:hypothetical protein